MEMLDGSRESFGFQSMRRELSASSDIRTHCMVATCTRALSIESRADCRQLA